MRKSAYIKWTIGATMASAMAGLLVMPSLAPAGEGPKDEVFSVTHVVTVAGNPLVSFDISWVDPSLSAYFLADRSNQAVDVVDTGSLTAIHQYMAGFRGFTGNNDSSGPNGVLTFNNKGTDEIWVGDGPSSACNTNAGVVTPSACAGTGGSTVKVLNYNTGAVIADIPTNGFWRADEMCYDPKDHLVQVANDAEADTAGTHPFVSFISTDTYKVLGTISVPVATNGIEQCQWNARNGLIYLNIPEVSGAGNDTSDGNVYVIDPKKMKVVDKFVIPVSECAGPQGMAIGPSSQILLGCNAASVGSGIQNAAIINENSGKITHLLKGMGGNDEVWFNEGDGHYFLAEGQNAAGDQLGIVDSSGARPDQSVLVGNSGGTTRRTHSVAADSDSNQVFMPIPGTGGTPLPAFSSSVCGTSSTAQAQGCIAVITVTSGKDDHPKFVRRHGGDGDDDGDDHGKN